MSDELRRHAWSFGAAADAYERSRPDYPTAAVRWVLDGCRREVRRVLDLGAGTGKLTRTLVALGLEVVAVEPSASMLGVLTAALPSVEGLIGSGEALPLPDASVDVVVCGQAWHWVDPLLAVPEVARVLRPGGVLGLLWNMRDETQPWVAALSDAMDNHEDTVGLLADPGAAPDGLSPPLSEPESLVVAHEVLISPADLRPLALSRSHVLVREPADRERLLARVDDVARSHPDLAGRERVAMPYRTIVWRAGLPA